MISKRKPAKSQEQAGLYCQINFNHFETDESVRRWENCVPAYKVNFAFLEVLFKLRSKQSEINL